MVCCVRSDPCSASGIGPSSYYRGLEFPVLQCIWPDKQQHYPWQPEFKQAWLSAQPLSFESEPEAARVGRLLQAMDGE